MFDSCEYVKSGFFYITNPMWKHAKRTKFSPNNLIFVTEGVLYIEENGIRYKVNQGECLFLKKGGTSDGYHPSGVNTGFYFVLFESDGDVPFKKHFSLCNTHNVQVLFSQLIQHLVYTDFPHEAMNNIMKALFMEVIYRSEPHETKEKGLSERIKDFVSGGTVWKNITVEEIADNFGYSTTYISRVFRENEHIQLKKYLDNVKVQKMQEYLSSTHHSVLKISEIMGFTSPSTFCKFFKYHTDMTPNEYRKQFYTDKLGK